MRLSEAQSELKDFMWWVGARGREGEGSRPDSRGALVHEGPEVEVQLCLLLPRDAAIASMQLPSHTTLVWPPAIHAARMQPVLGPAILMCA